MPELPVVVIGAGPVGLAAAAHLHERGLTPLVLEAGPHAGAAVTEWGHVRLFSPWEFLVDAAARRLLEASGWQGPDPEHLPTGAEFVRDYLGPLAAAPGLAGRVHTGSRVVGVTREAGESGPFVVRVRGAGGTREHRARAVVDASGTWGTPRGLGMGGAPVPGETDAVWPPLPDVLGRDREAFEGKRVLVVGSGHSAAGTLLALSEVPGTEIHWAIRRAAPDAAFGGGDADELPGRGRLGSRLRALVEGGGLTVHAVFTVESVAGGRVTGRTPEGPRAIAVDSVVAAAGFRPDLSFLGDLRLSLDPELEAPLALAPLIDPAFHSCGTVEPHGARLLAHPEDDFYIAGMKSYGRAPTFLAATGYEQVRSIAAALAGDREAADRVDLVLPETGVCSVPGDADGGCCEAPTPVSLGLPTGLAHGVSVGVATDGEAPQ